MNRIFVKYLGNIYAAAAWTLLIAFLLSLPGTMLPNEAGFFISQFDKLVHISLFGGFVILWSLYVSRKPLPPGKMIRWFFVIYFLSNGYGIGMEFVQKYWIPFRDFDMADIIADMIGAGLGYGVANLCLLKTS